MRWLLFTNIDTDINEKITRIRYCLSDYKFQRIIVTNDIECDNGKDTVEMLEYDIIRYINDNVAMKDMIYLVCNLKTKRINDSELINKMMPKLSKYVKEKIDLSSLWLTMDIYNFNATNNINSMDNCMIKVYGNFLETNNIGNGLSNLLF